MWTSCMEKTWSYCNILLFCSHYRVWLSYKWFYDVQDSSSYAYQMQNSSEHFKKSLITYTDSQDCYFGWLQKFFSIALIATGGCDNFGFRDNFNMESFVNITIFPFLEELTNEINEAFNILEPFKGSTSISALIPIDSRELHNFVEIRRS